MHKIFSIVSIFLSSLLIVFSICLFIVGLYPFSVLELKSPLEVIPQSISVAQGDCVFVNMHYIQNISGNAVVTAQAITENNINIASMLLGVNLEQGEHRLVIGFMLPRNINLLSNKPTLTSKLKITFQYRIWGIKTIDCVFYTDNFEIILVDK